jgi:predicted PurR-regulated permease PerM
MRQEPESAPDAPWFRSTTREWARRRDVAITLFISSIGLLFLLWLAGHVISTLVLLAIAMLIAYALTPAVNALARTVPRWLAVAVVYVIFVGCLVGILAVTVNSIANEVMSLVQYVHALLTPGQGGRSGGAIQHLLARLGISSTQVRDAAQAALAQARGLAGSVLPVISGVATVVIDLVVVIVLSIYFLADGPRVGRWLRTRSPVSQRERAIFVLETCNRVLGGYIRGQVTLCALVGLLVGFGMQFVFHLPFAILLGIFAFLLEFIPFLGVFVSGLACVLVGLFSGGPLVAFLVLGYFVLVHIFEGDVVGPRIVGAAVGIHPAVSLVALIIGAEVFGLWGALFAAPVAGVLQAFATTFWMEYAQEHPEEFPPVQPPLPASAGGSPEAFHQEPDDGERGLARGISGMRRIFFPRRRPRYPLSS